MSYAISTADQFSFQRFLFYSVFLHLALSVVMLASVWLQRSGNQWGSIGGDGDSSLKVNIVAPAGILMLQPTNVTDSGVADPTKSLHKADPLPDSHLRAEFFLTDWPSSRFRARVPRRIRRGPC